MYVIRRGAHAPRRLIVCMYTIRDVIGINVLNPLVFSPMRKAIYGANRQAIPFLEQSVIRRSSFLVVNVSLATSRYSGNTRLA